MGERGKKQFSSNVFQLVANFQKKSGLPPPEKTRPELGSPVRSGGAGVRAGDVLGEVGSVSISKALWLLAN